MSNYNTNLKTWGDKGTEYPNGHSQQDDVPPVDAWHDFLFYNQIEDIQHLISLTNDRLETDIGTSYVSSPEDGHIMYRTDTETFEVYDSTNGSWKDVTWGQDFRAHKNTVSGNPHSVTLEDARADNNTVNGDIDMGDASLRNIWRADFKDAASTDTANFFTIVNDGDKFQIQERDGTDAYVDSVLEIQEGGATKVNGPLTVSGNTTFASGTTLNMNDTVLKGNNSNTIDFGGASGHITIDADVRIADHVHWESDHAAFFGGLHNFSVRYASANDELLIKDEEAGNRVASFPKSSPAIMDHGLQVDKDATIHSALTQGHNPNQVLNETTSPKGFDVNGNEHRDYSEKQVVHLSNGSTASATETVTVEFYDGTDTTGTLLTSESKSVSVAAGGSKQVSFNVQDVNMDNGTYHVNVTTSGSTLAVDQTDQHLRGATYTFDQNATGDWQLTDEKGQKAFQLDAETNAFTSFPDIHDTLQINSGDLNLSTGTLRWGSQDGTANGYKIHPSSSSNGDLVFVDEGGGGNESMRLRDGGAVDIKGGTLHMNGNQIDISNSYIYGHNGNYVIEHSNDNWRHQTTSGKQFQFDAYDINNSVTNRVLTIDGSGKVTVPSGNLGLNGNGILNVNRETFTSGANILAKNSGQLSIETGNGSGSGYVRWYDTNGGQELLRGDEGGNVSVPNGDIDHSGSGGLIKGSNGAIGLDGGSEFDFNLAGSTADFRFHNSGTDMFRVYNNGDAQLHDGTLTHGHNPGDTISESTSPKGWDFSGDTGRDVHSQNDVTISNGSTASATETVTVELYDGTDTTGTLVTSESKSVSVGAGASKTVTFISGDYHLDNGTYHVNITTSGTTLAIDKSVEYTRGAEYKFDQDSRGRLLLQDELGQNFARLDHLGNGWNFQGNNLTNINSIKGIAEGHRIAGDKFTAGTNNTGHYGYYEVENPNGTRGAYFGWGNGGSSVDLNLDNASQLNLEGGDLNMSGNTITGIDPQSEAHPLIQLKLDSGTTGQNWADIIRTDNASGDNYRIHTNVSNNEPLLVYNDSTGTRMLEVRNGGVKAFGDYVTSSSSGKYDIQKNGSDTTGVINFKT